MDNEKTVNIIYCTYTVLLPKKADFKTIFPPKIDKHILYIERKSLS